MKSPSLAEEMGLRHMGHWRSCWQRWAMFLANGASNGSATGTLLRWFLGAGDIGHGPCSTHFETPSLCTPVRPLHASIMESQLHQHGPQLLLREILSSVPLANFVTQLHTDPALVLLISGCLPACLHEPPLRCRNKRLNQTLRFAVIRPPSLRRGLAQLVDEGHGFDGMRILWPCTSGGKGLGQQKAHVTIDTASQHKHS